ncbi:hypothetical protein ACSXAB_13835 [Clostridium perfringens]
MENEKYKRKYDKYITFGSLEDEKESKVLNPKLIEDLEKYHDIILQKKYCYTKSSIATVFDFNPSFVQKFIIDDFEPLFITKRIKNIIKMVLNYEDNFGVVEQRKIDKLVIDIVNFIPDYKAILFFKEEDLIKWILKSFTKEVYVKNKENSLDIIEKKVTIEDAKLILEKGLKRNKTIGENNGLDHSMKVARHIKKGLENEKYIKYKFLNKKNPNKTTKEIIRYMVMY